jgi:HAE1 family hydrophobic/amphiphilic exporter-1
VVLENIDRHRRQGKGPFDAAYGGATEVWGAVVTSTVTTVAVFLPIIFIQEEAGQLFRDIAIAITCSVSLSLIVSVTVIPMLSKQLFSIGQGTKEAEGSTDRFGKIVTIGRTISDFLMGLVNWTIKDVKTRLITITSLILFAVLMAVILMPKMEYLPVGNRNLIINILIPPPGLSYTERKEMGEYIFNTVGPHIGKEHNNLPAIKNMFYVGSEQIMLFGAISEDPTRVKELLPLFKGVIFSMPAMFGISSQASIFGRRLGRGRTIDIDLSGGDLDGLVMAAGMMFGAIKGQIPNAQIRPKPSLELLYPEVRIIPDRERLKSAGLSARELGLYLDVLMDGRQIGDFKEEGKKKIDLVVKALEADYDTPEALFEAPITTSGGNIVPVSSLSTLFRTSGITEIRHLERLRTVTLQITPPKSMPLQEAMELLEEKVVPGLRAKGLLKGMEVSLSGAADKLTETRRALQWNFLLAAFITYLLMSALFGNFIYPLIIMLTVPLAAAGGFIGLRLVNIFIAPQPLDVLTMLGFVILIGVVVNNAILIIHQSLNNIHLHNMDHRHAVLEATRTRLRPIYMSAATSIFGMLPLVLMPGPGSELYRGLGSVVLGGLALSTVFTVFIIPAILIFFIKMEKTDVHT